MTPPRPGGLPSVAIAQLADRHQSAGESEWVTVQASASHPFWSRDGRLLYYLPATPTVDIRNRVAARRFDPSAGRLDGDPFIVLNLSEMIVPAMVPAVAPIVAPDQIDLRARELQRRRLDQRCLSRASHTD